MDNQNWSKRLETFKSFLKRSYVLYIVIIIVGYLISNYYDNNLFLWLGIAIVIFLVYKNWSVKNKIDKPGLTNTPASICPHCKENVNPKAVKCPHCQSKIYRWTKGRVILFGFLAFAMVLMIVSINSRDDNNPKKNVMNTDTSVTTVFDIPSLVGKNLNELIVILGTPTNNTEPTTLQLSSGLFTTWEKSWSENGYFIMATYDFKTKKVIDLFLGADIDKTFRVFQDTNNILKIGNLSRSTNDYSLEFVKAINATGYTGVIVREI